MKRGMVKELREFLGRENVLTQEVDLRCYGYDSSICSPSIPKIVLFPTTTQQLGKVIKILAQEEFNITIRGAGTNLSGGTIPHHKKGAVIVTTKLNRILEINTEDLYARVEPGVITEYFANKVRGKGLFYPPDPGSQRVSTLGGNVAENAGGLRGLKYGVTKDYVMGINFFDVYGELITSGGKTVKCVTGYNIPSLMVGSEGTLGVISEIILKLIPPPATSKAMVAVFDNIERASTSVSQIIANKILPCTLELLDNFTIRAVEEFRKTNLPLDAGALLLIEIDGHPMQVEEETGAIEKILSSQGARDIKTAHCAEEKANIWQARRDALPALSRLSPTTILEDATVPRSKIPEMINAILTIQKKYRLNIGTFGHAGDGNLHPTILTDIRNKEEMKRVEDAIDELFDVAISLGGTLSGEHGIGIAKSKYMEKEVSRGTIIYSKRLKKALDPLGLLNPDKIFSY